MVSGTTGESPTTTVAEDGEILRAVIDAVGDRATVVAGVGTNHTEHSVELAAQAQEAGADGVLLVSPYYNKPTQEGIAAHFEAVAAASDLRIMLYDIPGRTGVTIAPETFARIAADEKFVAVKDAVGDLYRGVKIMQETGLSYYSGDDVLNLGWLTHGGAGVVSVVGHVAGEQYADMVARVDAGDLDGALQGLRRARPGRRRDHGPGAGRDDRQGRDGAARRPRQPRGPAAARRGRRGARRRSSAPPSPRQAFSVEPSPPRAVRSPALPAGGLRVIPLGGLGEVGRNMTVFEYDGRLLIVDCGVLFPEENHPGVDLILPDFDAIRDRLDDIEALVLTHGHEDHIGAVPYLLRERPDIPLVGSQLTLALLGSKLREHRHQGHRRSTIVAEGDRITLRPVRPRVRRGQPLDPRRARRRDPHRRRAWSCTPATSRWTSCRSTAGSPTCARFARLGEEGVDLFLVDSTNAEVPGFTTSEQDIAPVLDRVFHTSKQRIIVACFASHVHRVQQVMDAAAEHGRKVAYVGRSMVRNMGIARDLGYLDVPPGPLIDAKATADMPPEQVVLISTGSQGEPLSALSRIAQRNHNFVHIEEGDTVVLASSLIPGNENAVYRVINGLARWGANVVHKGNALVHVSGHASAGELLYCYNIVKPRNVMPVHGEIRHMLANADAGQGDRRRPPSGW